MRLCRLTLTSSITYGFRNSSIPGLWTFDAAPKINGVVAILFGVSGAGKTTIGKLLAQELGWKFYEADDFHSQSNINKMRRGVPLTDHDRQPWLTKLRELIERCLAANEDAVLACSALKEKYRQRLRVNDQVNFVYLRGDYAFVVGQLRKRRGHFMNPALLKSQFADLEEPSSREDAIPIELGRSPRTLVTEIKKRLHLDAAGTTGALASDALAPQGRGRKLKNV